MSYPIGYNKGDYSKRTFDESKNYFEVLEQQGVPIADYDVNERGEIYKNHFKRFIMDLYGDFCIGNAFKIESLPEVEYDTFESLINWSTNSGSLALDNINPYQGSNSIKLTGSSISTTVKKSVSLDLSNYTALTFLIKANSDNQNFQFYIKDANLNISYWDHSALVSGEWELKENVLYNPDSNSGNNANLSIITELGFKNLNTGIDFNFDIITFCSANDFKINGGIGNNADHQFNSRAYIQGIPVLISENKKYRDQEITQDELIPPDTGTRTDIVYLDVWLQEINHEEDSDIILPGTSFSATTRLKTVFEIKVTQGSRPFDRYIDSNGIPHFTFLLAKLERTTSQLIKNSIITDLRSYMPDAGNVESNYSENFALANGNILTVKINEGTEQTITFNTSDFVDISQATAEEVSKVISKNLNDGISFASSENTKVSIRTRKLGSTSSVQVTGGNANLVLNFPTNINYGVDSSISLKTKAKWG